MRVNVLSWNTIDLDINREKIVEEAHRQLDKKLKRKDDIIDIEEVGIDINEIIQDLVCEELENKNIQFEDYEIID